MDYQLLVDPVKTPCAVLSVANAEHRENAEIRVLCRNEAMAAVMGDQFTPGMYYARSGERNLRFEEFCRRAVQRGEIIHDYSYIHEIDGWAEIVLNPLCAEGEGRQLCQLMLEPTKAADAKHLAKVSPEASAAVINACITLMGAGTLQEGLESVLRDMMDATGACCCRIVLTNDENRTVSTLCECARPESSAAGKTFSLIRRWEETEGLTRTMIVTKPEELQVLRKHNPAWAQRMDEAGLESLFLLPLRRDQARIGFLYFADFNVDKVVEIKEIAELIGYFLGTQIANQLLVDQLEEMSYTDGLTGLSNRHSMLRRVRALKTSWRNGNFGVINLDLNGLKTVNDTEGHAAGDQLLVHAAETLTKVFYREDVFRTGGDEFVIVATNIDESTFQRKLERLRALAEKDAEVSFAIGAFWSDGTMDATGAFHVADEHMYADKEAFYRKHPELRRK